MERKEAYRSHVGGSASDPVKGGSKGSWFAGSKDHETENDTYISNYAETTGHDERDELMKEAELETGNKRVPATFPKQTRKQRRSKHERRPSLENNGYSMMCCRKDVPSGWKEEELPFREPNPGIKRPPVTVFRPLPPPPPPTL